MDQLTSQISRNNINYKALQNQYKFEEISENSTGSHK